MNFELAQSETTPSESIYIGNRELATRYFLAPLAGYTQLSFRTAMREIGGLGLATTDLVLATHLLGKKRKSLDLIATSPADRPLSVQIFSGITEHLVKGATWLVEQGFGGIDINMGCPMAKVNSNGGGARLMCDVIGARETTKAVIEAVEKVNPAVPVTVKMRLGWDRENITAPKLARQFEDVGVAAVTVHGRTRQQGFHGDVMIDGIAEVVAAVDSMPVVGNGDVRTVEDAFRMREQTGCHAVAIGRGAMMDPWIFRKIQQATRGETPVEPTADEQIQFLIRHFYLMAEQHQEMSCILFRKFAGWYGAKLGIPEELEDCLRRFESFTEFDEIVEQIRERHGERESTIPTALIKTPNGPIDKW